jgi:hypothetical protein
MKNLLVLHECKDARNNDMNARSFPSSTSDSGGSSGLPNAEDCQSGLTQLDGDFMDFIAVSAEDDGNVVGDAEADPRPSPALVPMSLQPSSHSNIFPLSFSRCRGLFLFHSG